MRLLTPDGLEAALRTIGEERYHIHHPFHHLLHGGKLTKGQVQAWALNRYYYQAFRIKGFGPLLVAMDAHGGSLYATVNAEAAKRRQAVLEKLGAA